jgi:heat shock protein HspQ
MVESYIPVSNAQFSIGELVHHKLFDYRGVIVDVDAEFQLTDEWYDQVARSRPPKDKPWYHVLVDDARNSTYVAERNLEPDPSGEAINHPLIPHFFTRLENGRYIKDVKTN